jgi:Tat protein secretion system quality control protein TatD with DNase activity
MKLSLTLHGKVYSVESDEQFDGTEVSELAEQFKGLLVNAGYHPSNVDELFNTEYQWFEESEEEKSINQMKRSRQ